jgi:PAS domain S-box-containing protein
VLLAVHMEQSAVLAAWSRQARQILSIALPALLALLGIGLALVWRQRRLELKKAELAEQRRLAASVFDSSIDAIIVTDAGARVLSVNPAFERVTGYGASEILGRNPRLMASGRHDRGFYTRMWAEVRQHGRWQGEIVNRHKSGRIYTALLRINAVYDDAGQLCHYAGLIADISERKAAEERLQLAASVFTHANEAIMITTPQADLVEVNEAFERITGYGRAEVLGRNARVLSAPAARARAFMRVCGNPCSATADGPAKSGTAASPARCRSAMPTINVRDPDGHVASAWPVFRHLSRRNTNCAWSTSPTMTPSPGCRTGCCWPAGSARPWHRPGAARTGSPWSSRSGRLQGQRPAWTRQGRQAAGGAGRAAAAHPARG